MAFIRDINSLSPGRCGWDFKSANVKHNLGIDIMSIQVPGMNAREPQWWHVNIGSGDGLVPSGNKPLPESVLAKISRKLGHKKLTNSFLYNCLQII